MCPDPARTIRSGLDGRETGRVDVTRGSAYGIVYGAAAGTGLWSAVIALAWLLAHH